MITSVDGKSYDSADGSEQPDAASAASAGKLRVVTSPDRATADRADINRFNDDGAAPNHAPPPAPPPRRKPLWSVLSLRDLARAIGLSAAPETVARDERARVDRGRASAEEGRERRPAEADLLAADPNRNAWENT